MQQVSYAVKHKDETIRMNSRSGGMFSSLSDYILNKNGKIYGCVLNDNLEAIHIGVDNKIERNKMRGAKYIQSNTLNTFNEVKKDLEQNMLVLYTGTPCQIYGLKCFLGKEYENLYCIDIVCHGVPSPKVYREFIKWNEKKYKSKCTGIDFRNKKRYGWNSHVETLFLQKKNVEIKINSKIFANIFYSHYCLRPSCYQCKFKNLNRVGEITIADYWGIDKISTDFNDNKGVSLVIVNNEKGKMLFENVNNTFDFIITDLNESLQPPLVSQYEVPIDREEFWNDIKKGKINNIIKKYGKNTLKYKCIELKDKILYKLKNI